MNMSRPFLLLAAALPFIEILALIRLVTALGFLATLAWLLLAAAAGFALIQRQGLSALTRSQQALARGELPTQDVVNSGIAVLGGVLLIVPGPFSDLLALPCLVPATRRRLADRLIAARFAVPGAPGVSPAARPDSVIEGEFRRED